MSLHLAQDLHQHVAPRAVALQHEIDGSGDVFGLEHEQQQATTEPFDTPGTCPHLTLLKARRNAAEILGCTTDQGDAMKILVAVDGSVYTKHMLAYLAAHDEWLGKTHQYTVAHCAPRVPPRSAAVLDRETLKNYYAEECEKVLKPIRAFFGRHGLDVNYKATSGDPAQVIAELADEGKFDLLIMGSHGHGALGNLVMGSVATKVLASCKTPLLIVR
jgi:nucleotide-binding universal stress UspA family protein